MDKPEPSQAVTVDEIATSQLALAKAQALLARVSEKKSSSMASNVLDAVRTARTHNTDEQPVSVEKD